MAKDQAPAETSDAQTRNRLKLEDVEKIVKSDIPTDKTAKRELYAELVKVHESLQGRLVTMHKTYTRMQELHKECGEKLDQLF